MKRTVETPDLEALLPQGSEETLTLSDRAGSRDRAPQSGSCQRGYVLLVGGSRRVRELADGLSRLELPTTVLEPEHLSLLESNLDRAWACVIVGDELDTRVLKMARQAVASSDDLTPLVIFEQETVPDVIREIRRGARVRFLPATTPTQTVIAAIAGQFATRRNEEARRADRREFPRVAPAGVELRKPDNAVLVDLAPGGIALRCDTPLAVGALVPVALRLGRAATLRVQAQVVRTDLDELGRRWVAAQFVDAPERTRTLLLGLLRRHLAAQGPREMQRRFRESSAVDIVPIAARANIARFLSHSQHNHLPYHLQGGIGGTDWRSPLLEVNEAEGWFELEAPAASATIAPGQTIDCLLHHDFESYLFEAKLLSATVERFRCEFPGVIYYSEKRSRLRHDWASSHDLKAAIQDPRRPSHWIRFPVLDLSESGASFEVDLEDALLFPGSVFDPVVVAFGDVEVLRERAEIRHITSITGEARCKVGLRFVARRAQPRSEAGSALRQALSRPQLSGKPHRSQVVKFRNESGEELVALLNRTVRHENFTAPVVVLLPSWGHSKESFSAYALTLIESFESRGEPLVVLRIDYTHHKGESYVPPDNRRAGREAITFKPSHAVSDILATVGFAYDNPLFTPTSLTLVGPSLNGQLALSAATEDSRISHLVLPMGAPSIQSIIQNATGGLDYIGGYARGLRFGIVNFLGLLVDMDAIAADAIEHHLGFLDDAVAAAGRQRISVTWLAGEHDAWVNPQHIEQVLQSWGESDAELLKLGVGHLPTHDEALIVAAEVARSTLRHLELQPDPVVVPSPEALDAAAREEWERAPKAGIQSAADYWGSYLLGEGGSSLGFDVLAYTAAYQDFARTQVEMLALEGNETMLDAGAGTGQFATYTLTQEHSARPAKLRLIDLIPEALDRAKARLSLTAAASDVELSYQSVNLETSRLTPIARFLAGEYHSPRCLGGRIEGLSGEVVERIVSVYEGPEGADLHTALRGGPLSEALLAELDADVLTVVRDMGKVARWLTGRPAVGEAAARLPAAFGQAPSRPATQSLPPLEKLVLGDGCVPAPLDLPDAAFDRIVCSLVLPYLMNPDETLLELVRALRPGGRIVVSTMKPDTDMSTLQLDLVERVTSGAVTVPNGMSHENFIQEIREYMNSAAFLLRLTDEGTFRFLRADSLRDLMRQVGLTDVELRACFGTPTQAFVATGRKPV